MRGRLLHTINSLALSVTCGDTAPCGRAGKSKGFDCEGELAKEKSICSKNS